MFYDCQTCGACCCNPDENRAEGVDEWVEVLPTDRLRQRPRLLERLAVTNDRGEVHLRLDDQQRCVALRGTLGRHVSCSIYADRPRGCRLVEAGSPRCEQYRAERGIA